MGTNERITRAVTAARAVMYRLHVRDRELLNPEVIVDDLERAVRDAPNPEQIMTELTLFYGCCMKAAVMWLARNSAENQSKAKECLAIFDDTNSLTVVIGPCAELVGELPPEPPQPDPYLPERKLW